MHRSTKKAPVREHQGQGDRGCGNTQSHIESSVHLLKEENTMSTSLSENVSVVESECAYDTRVHDMNTAIREHCKKSKISVSTLAALAKIPVSVLSRKMNHPEQVFTVGEVGNLSRVLNMEPSEMLVRPDPEPTLTCAREICSVRHHQQFADGRQGDMCRIDGIDSDGDLWNVFALSNGKGERWAAAIDLTGCDDLEGDAGITVMREALAAFTKAQAYCNALNGAEGLN